MNRIACAALVAVACALAACGSEEEEHEPLISGSVTGSFEGSEFTVAEGVATEVDSGYVIVLGTDAINCSSADQASPPSGYFAAISMPSYDVGTYESVLVIVYENHGNFNGHGSTIGTVAITSSSDASVAGSVSFDYTDSDTGEVYALNGTFEVVSCLP